MKRTIVSEEGIAIVEVEVPRPLPGEALIETTVSGVCGSDTHAAAGNHPFIPMPYFPGHEVVGVIRGLGVDVIGLSVADRVVVEPTLPCWKCKMCLTGRSNICENLQFFGCGYGQGGMADYFTISADRLHVIPNNISDLQAVLIEPLATPVHAVRLAGNVEGKAAVVIGAGTIGLLVLKALRYAGARTIVMTDVLRSKRERAIRLGANAAVDAGKEDVVCAVRAELGESADFVFDCVAIQNTVDQAMRLAFKGGTVVIVGVPPQPVQIPLPELQDLQVRIQGSATYMPEDFAVAREIIATGAVAPADFITAEFPLEEVADAFEASAAGQEVKVVVVTSSLPTRSD